MREVKPRFAAACVGGGTPNTDLTIIEEMTRMTAKDHCTSPYQIGQVNSGGVL